VRYRPARESQLAKSQKPLVIQRIYETLLDPATGQLRRTVVTGRDVMDAIDWANANHGSTLSNRNPANFIKDVIRGKGASGMWPDSLKAARITAKQTTGGGNVFEFVPYDVGQADPFPDRFGYHPGVQRHKVQTISVPLATKALGRDDETYLIQVAVKLGIVETHFALHSPIDVVELYHLQIGIKLRLCEVDALYAAKYMLDGVQHDMVITVEAKKKRQRILVEQVVQQVRAAFNETAVNLVVPIALTAVEGGIYIAEFKAIQRDQLGDFDDLELQTEAMYELTPPVAGI
jgi:hypothetical protein